MDWLACEAEKIKQGYSVICGVDEAGRGPLAGPVFAAAVILSGDYIIDGIDDSKKLSEKNRELMFDIICSHATDYSIASVDPMEIDRINILNATMLAMKKAVEGLRIRPDLVLIDGNRVPELSVQAVALIKGDSISSSIAAASILAKVSRDRYMQNIAKEYPEYEFERHKGYPTKLHYERIAEYGISPIHRKSFLKRINY